MLLVAAWPLASTVIGPNVCTELLEQSAVSYSENVTVPATIAPPEAVTVAVSCGNHFCAVVMLATITIASQQRQFIGVWLGSTVGMVAADGLAIVVGTVLGARLPERAIRSVAAALFVTTKTIVWHRQSIMGKLGLRTVAELTKYAVRMGLTSLDA